MTDNTALALAGNAANGTKEALDFLLSAAREQIMKQHGNIANSGAPLEAEVAMRMLQLAGEIRAAYRDMQALLVMHVVEEQLWPAHPNNYGEGRSGLRRFLRDCGLGESTVSEMTGFALDVVPFCQEHDILVEDTAGPGEWFKTREALTALKTAVREGNTTQVKAILSDVREVGGREPHLALRAKYRSSRTKVVGHGTTVGFDDGAVALVVVYAEDGEHVQAAVRKLGGPVKWDLVVGRQDANSHFKIVIEKPGGAND